LQKMDGRSGDDEDDCEEDAGDQEDDIHDVLSFSRWVQRTTSHMGTNRIGLGVVRHADRLEPLGPGLSAGRPHPAGHDFDRFMCRHFLSGAAQESNLPSVGLPRLTGFEDLEERPVCR
jgi:hypothetical protein